MAVILKWARSWYVSDMGRESEACADHTWPQPMQVLPKEISSLHYSVFEPILSATESHGGGFLF
jgi:hypothetical protein